MSELRACPECGASLPPDAPRGLCPKCLMGAAFSATATHKPAAGSSVPATPSAGPPVDFAEFCRAVVETGLIDAEEFERFAASAPGDVARTARELVRAGKLTAYQAGALAQGKGRGLVLGSYLVLDKIGQGGMGVVFKARHRRDGRVVALKILPPSFCRDREAVLRFRREFEVAARLNHPNVVAAIDADEDRGVQFLTMDFIDGHDLDELVNAVGPLPIKLAINCAIQAATGLAAAHAQGIIHRDIKPGNLMLDASGVVRVLDLGLARVVAGSSPLGRTAGTNLTQSGAYMGTVDFMAPEQADDSKKADLRADIYSLGCTLHFLLTGRPPFEGDSALKRLMAHQGRPAPSLHASRNDVPAPLEAAYQTMMAKRPGDRPRSMTEVVEMLEACRSSSEEARDARAGLSKAFAATVMKRASPRGKDRARNASLFARPSADDGAGFDPDLRFEDVVMDLRPEYHAKPLREDQLPPLLPRLAPPKRRSRRRVPTNVLWMLAFAVLGAVGYVLWTRSRPAPEPTAEVVPAGLSVRAEAPFRPLFNGKDLTGWVARYSEPKDWPVEGGALVARGRGVTFMALMTDRSYFDFVLRLEYQASKRADSGVLLIGPQRGVNTWHEEFHIGDIGAGTSWTGDFVTWGGMGSGRFLPVGPNARLDKADGSWNALEVERRGGKLSLTINGRKIHDGLDGDSGPRRIGFQAMDGVVRFRKIEIRELPDAVPSPTPSAEDLPILARLDEPTALEVRGGPLEGFLRAVEVATVAPGLPKGLPIVVDADALQAHGKTPKTWVMVRPKGTLKETLASTLEPSGLGYVVRDGTLRITSDFLAARATRPGPSGFASLFNGKDLTGWVQWNSRPGDWTVDGRAVVARGRGDKGMTIVTNRAYSDFALRFEYRTSGQVDSGVLLIAPGRDGDVWREEFNIISNVPESYFKTGDLLTWGEAGDNHSLPAVSAAPVWDEAGSWNAVEVERRGDSLSFAVNGRRVHAGPGAGLGPRRVGFQGMDGEIRFRNIEIRELPPQAPRPAEGTAGPSGFASLFNGKDLAGWAGQIGDYEVRDGVLRNKTRESATIYYPKEYADFAARVEFRVPPGGNSGLAIRNPGSGNLTEGMCEIEIIAESEQVSPQPTGSAFGVAAAKGGRQRPPAEWNVMEVTVRGSTVKVELNGAVVLDADLKQARDSVEGYPRSHVGRTSGYFGLTSYRAPVEFRKIEVRELPPAPPPLGFVPLFNGKDLVGWAGDVGDYEVRGGALRSKTKRQATIYLPKEYTDFAARVEFRTTPGGNGGLAIRYPGSGDPPFAGLCEIEIIDEASYTNVEPRQYSGSAYAVAAAKRGHQRPAGEWNTEEVTVRGSTVKVELNGAVILDADLAQVHETMNGADRPGRDRTSGYFGLTNVNAPVEYRKVEVLDLKGSLAAANPSPRGQ